MPVMTRSRSKRSNKEDSVAESVSSGSEGDFETPRRSARLAAKRSRSRDIPTIAQGNEGRQSSTTPAAAPFSGITLGTDSLAVPMQFLVPRHQADSTYDIREQIRQFTESPVTLKQTKKSLKRRQVTPQSSVRQTQAKRRRHSMSSTKPKQSLIIKNNIDSDRDSEDDSGNKQSHKNSSDTTDTTVDNNTNPTPNRNRRSPNRIPALNRHSSSWSPAYDDEGPMVARNLVGFMIGLVMVVLAVVYRDGLYSLYQDNNPLSMISELGSNFGDFSSNWFGGSTIPDDGSAATAATDDANAAGAGDAQGTAQTEQDAALSDSSGKDTSSGDGTAAAGTGTTEDSTDTNSAGEDSGVQSGTGQDSAGTAEAGDDPNKDE